MILRPYRRIRQLEQRVDTLQRVLSDERRYDLRDAISLAMSMHEKLTKQAEALDGYDEALRLGAEGQRNLGLGVGR